MTPTADRFWQTYISHPCEDCGAEPGEPCKSNPEVLARVWHPARQARAHRCPDCGDRLPRDTEPGDRCGRCQLLRDLGTEQATTHRRENP